MSPDSEQQSSAIQPSRQPIKERIKALHRISISKVPQFMARLSSTYFKPSNDVKRKYRSRSLADMTPNPQIPKQKHLSDDEASKKFDQLLSSPRLKMECNESVAPDMTSRFSK